MMFPSLLEARDAVTKHTLLSRTLTADEARIFMEHHVFAVWDFMSLLKRLQRELTCVTLPWRPSADARFARLVNEIVLAEESDEDGRGGHASHFELYLDAMREVGADTTAIEQLLVRVGLGDDPFAALGCAPEPAQRFTSHTLRLALDPRTPTVAVAAAFLHGREAIIPEMFRQLLASVGHAPRLRHYLERHVELDADQHGPMAEQLLADLCTDPALAAITEEAAREALVARRQLWDGVLAALPHRTSSSTTFLSDSRLLTVSTRSHDGA